MMTSLPPVPLKTPAEDQADLIEHLVVIRQHAAFGVWVGLTVIALVVLAGMQSRYNWPREAAVVIYGVAIVFISSVAGEIYRKRKRGG